MGSTGGVVDALKIAIEIEPYRDGRHCGHCHGRHRDPTFCAVFAEPVKTVAVYEQSAERCGKCLEATK